MCGIAGFFSDKASHLDNSEIKKVLRKIKHRGPDEFGYYSNKNFSFGIARLKIIDLKTGNQPIFNEKKNLVVVLNGEIYNYLQLKEKLIKNGHVFTSESDTEVLIHLYEEYQENMLEHLNGMFAFAIYNIKTGDLFIARDRIGIKPLYYYHRGGNFAFASELKSLLSLSFIKKNIDPEALMNYFMMEYVPAPLSIFKNIVKLMPGHFLIYKNNKIKIKKYWDVKKYGFYDNFNDSKSKLLSLMSDSVEKRMISDVPLGVFLSGGIDSSTIVHFSKKFCADKLHTFSIGFRDESFDETQYINIIKDRYNTIHHSKTFSMQKIFDLIPTVFSYLDEPFGDASILPTYMLSKFSREKITVALGGDGSDEIFAGYPTYQAHRFAFYYSKLPSFLKNVLYKVINKLPVSLDNFSIDFKLKKFISGIQYDEIIRNIIWLGSFNEIETNTLLKNESRDIYNIFDSIRNITSGMDDLNIIEKILYLDMKMYLQNDILVKVDRASMANSLEVRVPFLDHRIVEYAFNMPLHYKLNLFKTKYILKKAITTHIPDKIINRQKKGFGIPVAKWIKENFNTIITNILNKKEIKNDGILNYLYIQDLLDEHISGKKDNRKKLWTIIAFQLWRKNYLN